MRRRPTAIRKGTALLAMLLAAAAAACGDSTGPSTPIGAFTLESVDGRPMPVVLATSANYRLELREGGLTLTEAGTFTGAFVTRQTVDNFNEDYVDSTAGTWQKTATGAYVLFATGATAGDTLVWAGGKLTLTDRQSSPPVVYVFRRR